MKHYQYLIRSTQREPGDDYFGTFFCTFGSNEPIFGARLVARRFASLEMATAYARTLLFENDSLFVIEQIPELGQRIRTFSKICGEGQHEITADVALPKVVLRQGEQSLTIVNEEQLGELFELIEECFTVFDDARQPKP